MMKTFEPASGPENDPQAVERPGRKFQRRTHGLRRALLGREAFFGT
jgi:hypothetical protein